MNEQPSKNVTKSSLQNSVISVELEENLPSLKILYSGNKFIDPIDGKGYSKFLSYGYGKLRKNALSPGTLSLERHRLLWLYLKSTDLLNSKLKVLHIAPEPVSYTHLTLPTKA